ncbi:MAG: Holliday junction branch migration protein RuvA [Rhodospirillales bacterium]|nr:Holliday junction branch migration protein RuvA [Rhodospirillales bacterium]MCB9995726.1 Holliday junction branch migration protein RuvA [Rhodospirillales bacterium]
MIAKLSGILDSVSLGSLILDVNGVGYLVHASPRTLAKLGQAGDPVSLRIDTQVREDAFNLYGFIDAAEQEWFRLLTSVQGVGAKAAMAILGVTPPDQLGFAIAAGDKTALTRADGVGPKLAARILTELKDKAGKIDLTPQKAQLSSAPVKAETTEEDGVDQDAVSALVNLGYSRSDAYRAVLNAKQKSNDNKKINDIIKLALKELAS